MKVMVAGGSGFIGHYLVKRMLNEGKEVVVLDNLSTGKNRIENLLEEKKLEFHKVDVLKENVTQFMKNVDIVWHLAGNTDVRDSERNPEKVLIENVDMTKNLLDAAVKAGTRKFVFTSSSTVYGDSAKIPTPEGSPLKPVSNYGISKVMCEKMITTYNALYGINAVIFRLANVVGLFCHGVLNDFIEKLRENKKELEILGDGNQRKSYIHISDCIDSMFSGLLMSKKEFEIFNIGSDDWTYVKDIAQMVCEETGAKPDFKYTGGSRGWTGDMPLMLLHNSKIKETGWRPKHNSEEAIRKALKEMCGDVC